MFRLIFTLLFLVTASGALAQQSWKTTQITDGSVPAEIVPETRVIAENALPDGLITTIEGAEDIASAWYSEPTERYRHGVLGDAIEAGALRVQTPRGQTFTYRLQRTQVFEDISPRLADVDGDGRTEVITILSSLNRGASLAIFNLNGNALVKMAQSNFIGQSNRWLNVAGIGNFLGSGTDEIAIVVTPHIGGTMQLFKYHSGVLLPLIAARSYSNHVIGSRELRLSAQADVDGNGSTELILPSQDRRDLVIIGFTRSGLQEIARVNLPAPIDKAIGVENSGAETRFIVGLENGEIHAVHR